MDLLCEPSTWTCRVLPSPPTPRASHVGPQMGVLLLDGLVCFPVQPEKQSGLGSVSWEKRAEGRVRLLPWTSGVGRPRPFRAAASRCLIRDEIRRGDTVLLSLLFRLGH